MITAIKADNIGEYKALFEEASDILSGYKRVRTYDANVSEYFYKNGNAQSSDELFMLEESINSLTTFASALEKRSILYIKNLNEVTKEWEGVAQGFEPMLGITTLEEYFSWMQNLGKLNRKYTVLPLDEDHFEINANTRAINIPASFKKNGIAVQGDDLAEVVYFKIDRYFDYMDLYNTDIFIQWETPKDANGVVTKSVSPAYIRDIESEPGKLIFGWAISDAVTGASGNLKFSVRFFQWDTASDEKALAYSFSTLTAQVPIQPAIAFNPEKDEYVIDDAGKNIVGRLQNSIIVGGYAAAAPEFVKDLDVPNEDLIYDLIYDEETKTYSYALLAQAFSKDTGAISYTWKRQDLTEANTLDGTEITIIPGTNVMVEADLNNLNVAYSYFETNGSNSEGEPIWTLYTGAIPPTDEDVANGLKLYIKQSQCIADQTGVYWAVAENRITNSSSSQESKKAKFPRPKDIVITEQPVASSTLMDIDNDDPDLGAISKIEVKVEEQDSNIEVKTYQWYRDANYANNFGGQAPSWTKIEENGTDKEYVATLPGHYKVEVTNTRNNATKTLHSTNARVTYPAQVPVIVGGAINDKIFKINALAPDNCPTITLDDTIESDGYSVSWFLNQGDQNFEIVEGQKLEPGVVTASFNPLEYEDKIKALSGDTDIEGAYYPIVTNNVNGSQASTTMPADEDMFIIRN